MIELIPHFYITIANKMVQFYILHIILLFFVYFKLFIEYCYLLFTSG